MIQYPPLARIYSLGGHYLWSDNTLVIIYRHLDSETDRETGFGGRGRETDFFPVGEIKFEIFWYLTQGRGEGEVENLPPITTYLYFAVSLGEYSTV